MSSSRTRRLVLCVATYFTIPPSAYLSTYFLNNILKGLRLDERVCYMYLHLHIVGHPFLGRYIIIYLTFTLAYSGTLKKQILKNVEHEQR